MTEQPQQPQIIYVQIPQGGTGKVTKNQQVTVHKPINHLMHLTVWPILTLGLSLIWYVGRLIGRKTSS
jgi:hypothetical protein